MRRADRLKRALDVTVAGGGAILTAPLAAALAVAVALESRGGVIYRARRVGRHGRPFAMLKFRKMHAAAAGPALTVTRDARFTRMGRILARSRLDELPQLWNVLRGDMSLVGPRPEDPKFVAAMRDEYEPILAVRPGITGITQLVYRDEHALLTGDDPESDYLTRLLPAKIALDRRYVETRSLGLDLKILWWTARVLTGGGEIDISGPRPRFRRRPPGEGDPADTTRQAGDGR